MLEREAARGTIPLSTLTKPEYVDALLSRLSLFDWDDVCATVGFGAMSAVGVIGRLKEEYRRAERIAAPPSPQPTSVEENEKRRHLAESAGVYLAGEPGMLVRFAHCCNPVPGDEIVGYITRGRGVAVHKADCINALSFEPERMVEVSWANTESEFRAGLQIVAYDRDGLLADLAVLMGTMKAPIESVSAKIRFPTAPRRSPCSSRRKAASSWTG